MTDLGQLVFGKENTSLSATVTENEKNIIQVVKPVKPVETVKPIYNTYEDYNYDDLLTYAGIDTYVTSTIFSQSLFPKLIEKPDYTVVGLNGRPIKTQAKALIEIYEDCTAPLFDFICDLELSGIHYNPAENRRLNVTMAEETVVLEDRIFKQIGRKINLDSSLDVTGLLYGEMGMKPPHQTKSGDDAADGQALLLLAGMDPMAPGKYICENPKLQFLADMAKRKNLVSVRRGFIENYMEDYLKPDGRIHALYNQFGTSTFRLSSSEPNLQNIPRAFGVKRCFDVEEGNVFIAFDYSSAEIKFLCAISGDKNMRACLDAGRDFHSYAASEMYGIPYDKFMSILGDKKHPEFSAYKAMRQNSKALGFGLLYGSSAGGLSRNLNISIEEAERLIALYFSQFPQLKDYINNTHSAALWNRFVTTPLGHRRQFYGTYPAFKKTAAYNASMRGSQNYVIQSATAIVGAMSFAEINRELKKLGGRCIASVHDSLEAEVPLQHAAQAVEIFNYYMNDWPQKQFPWIGLSIGCDGDIGYNWQDTKEIHRGVTQTEIETILSTMT